MPIFSANKFVFKMSEKIFFQCSLPRVGSTLFQNLINQDPRFYASANNGLLNMITAARDNYTESAKFRVQEPDIMSKAFIGFCHGSMHGFYNAITDKQYILDKSRGNFANYNMVNNYYPGAKIICMVRNMPDIFASIEKLYRKNQHKTNAIVNHAIMQGITTPQRVDLWHRSFIPMMEKFAQSIYEGNDKKMLFIKYESFCLNPEAEMKRFYEFLNIPAYTHNFINIPKTIKEDEEMYEYTGLFNLRPMLQMRPSDAMNILGLDVYNWVMKKYQFYNDYFGYVN